MRISAPVLLAALLACSVAAVPGAAADRGGSAPASARKRPRTKSHRTRPRKEGPSREQKTKAPEGQPAPWAPTVRRLKTGRWLPEVSLALEKLLEFEGAGTAGYSPADPPVVVISWDDVAMTNRVGEAVFYRLVAEAAFKFDETFWEAVPPQYGRLRIRTGYEGFRDRPKAAWPKESYYLMYRKAFVRCYQKICSDVGGKECSDWLVKLLKGFRESEIRDFIKETVAEELGAAVAETAWGDSAEDLDPVIIRKGLRQIPEMEDLVRAFLAKGFDVWAVGSANEWSIQFVAGLYGIDQTRILGIRSKVRDGLLTSDTLIPIPFGSGKAAALSMFVARTPAAIIAGPDEEVLLNYGRGVRIVVGNPGAKRSAWSRLGWLLQSPFSPVRAPQRLGEDGNIVPFQVSNPGG